MCRRRRKEEEEGIVKTNKSKISQSAVGVVSVKWVQ